MVTAFVLVSLIAITFVGAYFVFSTDAQRPEVTTRQQETLEAAVHPENLRALNSARDVLKELAEELEGHRAFRSRQMSFQLKPSSDDKGERTSHLIVRMRTSALVTDDAQRLFNDISRGRRNIALACAFEVSKESLEADILVLHQRVTKNAVTQLVVQVVEELVRVERHFIQPKCPLCRKTLSADPLTKTCPAFHGRLIMPEQTSVFLARLDVTQRELLEQSENAKKSFECPHCETKMSHILLDDSHVELCRGCGCLWLDVGELGRLL